MLAGLLAAYLLGLHRYVSLGALVDQREMLRGFVSAHPLASAAVFMLAYTAVVAFSFPAASVLTIFSGFLFGCIAGGAMVVLAATVGACILFVAARTVFGDLLKRRAGPFLERFSEGFRRNAFNYLLILRLAPVFPFFVVNIAPAFFDVRLKTFAMATLIGIIPGTFVYAWLGSGLDDVIRNTAQAGLPLTISAFATKELTLALGALALIAALPVAVQAMRGKASTGRDTRKDGM